VHQVEDWAEVHRLFHREGLAKAAIARRLGMSRNTVERLLGLMGRRGMSRPRSSSFWRSLSLDICQRPSQSDGFRPRTDGDESPEHPARPGRGMHSDW
jgi:hypothetical protein